MSGVEEFGSPLTGRISEETVTGRTPEVDEVSIILRVRRKNFFLIKLEL